MIAHQTLVVCDGCKASLPGPVEGQPNEMAALARSREQRWRRTHVKTESRPFDLCPACIGKFAQANLLLKETM